MDNFAVPITYLFSDQLLYSSLGVHGQPFGGGRLLEYFRLIHEVLLAGFFTRACVQQQVEGCTMYVPYNLAYVVFTRKTRNRETV